MDSAVNRAHALDEALNRHYAPEDVSARILHSLRAAGLDPEHLTRDDAALFDEFHGGGRESTRAVARAIALAPGTRVLDIGCGIGGPARTLTAECGAVVTGVDLTHEFITAAVMLSERVGMGGQIEFLQGSALDLPVPDASFDLVWSQNMLMNLPDKPQFAREVARVLKPGGRCAIEAVVAGEGGDILYPCFWASEAALSFVPTAVELRAAFAQADMTETHWQDNTSKVLAHAQRRLAGLERSDGPALGIGVLVPDRVTEKTRNGLRNNEEGRTAAIQAVWQKAPAEIGGV